MQPFDLTPLEIATIGRTLSVYALERSSAILGAQLGLIVSDTIRPRSLRDYGGLRRVVEEQLHSLVTPAVNSATTADISYEIKATGAPATQALIISDEPIEVAGPELWRCFSNPNLHCQIAASPVSAQVYLLSARAQLPVGTQSLPRPNLNEFKALAIQFANTQTDPIRAALSGVLSHDDYYNLWIEALRRLRTPENNLLRQWEALRSEHVATKLKAALQGIGIDEPRVIEIVTAARPVAPQRMARTHIKVALEAQRNPRIARPAIQDDDFLRTLVHRAVDLMSDAELREIRVPAGLLQDAMRQPIN